ncbi:hypothetical protein D3C81_1241170 [compost metagenome]
MFQTPGQQTHQADARKTEHQCAEHLRPQGPKHRQQVDGVGKLPVRRLQLFAQYQLLRQPAVADESEEVLLAQQRQILPGGRLVTVAEERHPLRVEHGELASAVVA